MDYVGELLSSNFATIIAVLIAATCLLFIYYFAIPCYEERNALRLKLQEKESSTNPDLAQSVEQLQAALHDLRLVVESLRDTPTHNEEEQRELLAVVTEIRTHMSQLSSRMLGLSNAVHLALSKPHQQASFMSGTSELRGLRE